MLMVFMRYLWRDAGMVEQELWIFLAIAWAVWDS